MYLHIPVLTACNVFQLVRVLVSPMNPPGATSSCQKVMYQCGLLQQLCIILMATGVPADILTEVFSSLLIPQHMLHVSVILLLLFINLYFNRKIRVFLFSAWAVRIITKLFFLFEVEK